MADEKNDFLCERTRLVAEKQDIQGRITALESKRLTSHRHAVSKDLNHRNGMKAGIKIESDIARCKEPLTTRLAEIEAALSRLKSEAIKHSRSTAWSAEEKAKNKLSRLEIEANVISRLERIEGLLTRIADAIERQTAL